MPARKCECYGTLDDERRRIYKEVVPDGKMPLKGPLLKRARLGKDGETCEVYMVDVARLDDSQVEKLCEVLAELHGGTPSEAKTQLKEKGLPLLAEGITTAICDLHVRCML